MVSLDDLKDLVMYRKPFFLPVNLKDKKKWSAIVLLTPNYKSSMFAMTAPYTINRKYFESYYFEKTITRYIQNESVYDDDPGEYLLEEALSSKERNDLPDSDFGLPSQRRYPMPDKEHVLSAIRFFNHVEKEYEEELAKNIIKKIKEFNMADEIHVGKNNRFLPYWEKSGLSKLNESLLLESFNDRQKVINNICDALKKEGLTTHISKNSEWGLNQFLDGGDTLCLGSFDKDNYNKAYDIVKNNIPDEYKAKKDNYFTIFIDIKKSSIKEDYEILNDLYLDEFVATKGLDILNRKFFNNIYFSGYERDIDSVKRYVKKEDGILPFRRLKIHVPDKITVMVTNDPNAEEEITYYYFTLYTPHAFKKKNYSFTYDDYVRFMFQLYAIYTIKPVTGVHVLDVFAEPLAILLSGIADDEIDLYPDKYYSERVFRYIIEKRGIDEVKRILIGNDLALFYKYAKEYSETVTEADLGIDDDCYKLVSLLNEEGEIQIPESIKRIQNMATTLKRRIRRQSVYKLNKIVRDLQRGNVGSEEKGKGMTTLQQLQTGQLTGTSRVNTTPSSPEAPEGSVGEFVAWTKGDYIRQGNTMYLFEADINYDMILRKAMYKDRLRNYKQVMAVYANVKATMPFIKYAYYDLSRYNGKNIFYDLSRYNEQFFKNIDNYNEDGKMNNMRKFRIYAELMNRLLSIDDLASYKKKTIFIPILDWRHNNSMRMWMFKEDINPLSVIFYYIKNDRASLAKLFKDYDVVFMGAKNYFKINFSKVNFADNKNITKLTTLLRRMISLGYNSPADPDPEGEFEDSPTGIAMDIVDKVEKSQNVEINNVSKFENLNKSVNLYSDEPNVPVDKAVTKKATADATETKSSSSKKVKKSKSSPDADKDTKTASDDKSVNTTSEKDNKDAVVDKISQVANDSKSVDDALDKLNDDEFKELIASLQNDSEENVRVDKARASKVVQIEDEFHKKEVAGKSVKEMLETDPAETALESTKLKVSSINSDWNDMTFMNFDKNYDPDTDMIKMLDSMQNWTFPIAVKNIEVTDNSTSEDVISLWKIECVDYKGTRFTIKVDIPRFINDSNFLKLRGNEKNILIQSIPMPICKSGPDECQIIGSGGYNKIFVRRFGGRKGQSNPSTNKLIKTLNRLMDSKEIKVVQGDNTNTCAKYELPIDYMDIASIINSIESKNYRFYFNQDALRTEYSVDDTKGLPIGISKKYNSASKKTEEYVVYYDISAKKSFPTMIGYMSSLLYEDSEEFRNIYDNMRVAGSRYTYSKASILNTNIPVIVLCSYLEGLIPVLNKSGFAYEFVRELDKGKRYSESYDYIRFKDGYLTYEVNYSSSLLLNGLKECDTESYSIKDVNNRRMYLEFLENYGSLKSDGIENSYDCMIDPITKEILAMYKLPTDYVSIMLHTNTLLADNKYVRHIDQSVRRWRRKELIAGYFYKALTTAYEEYANILRRSRKNAKLSMKQSAVIDLIVSKDPATTDLSISNVVNDVECANTVTNKGLVGMNQARAYSVSTRTYDESMLNVLGMDTAFSGSVGINRQATVNANIEGGRGLVKTIDGDAEKLSVANTLTITEAVTPLGSTHDDPQRTLMTYMQTSKHMVRCLNSDPLLITTGADEAMPYLASNIFSYKAKKDGTIVELVEEGPYKDNYMVIQYKDGSSEYISLSEEIKKNSDGGYYVPLKLSTDLKVGAKVKQGDVVAYDKLSFSKSLGESGNLAASIGILSKVAIINTNEGFEDSAMITEGFAARMGTEVVMPVDAVVSKGSNLFVYKNIGDKVMEGDTIFAYQADFDEDSASSLLKNLAIDSEQLSELGRNPVKSKYTGVVADIKIYRTVELDELSESLRDFVSKYENKVKRTKRVYKKYGLDTATLPVTEKMDNVGMAKNVYDGVKIIYYIKFVDNMSIGDKMVFYSANKGVIKSIVPKGEEPYTDFRPDEPIDTFMSLSSISGRMTCSISIFAAVTKLMVELDRSIKDIAGIPYDVTKL